jgi:hypothetical protein
MRRIVAHSERIVAYRRAAPSSASRLCVDCRCKDKVWGEQHSMMTQAADLSVRPKARLAGAFYLAVFVAGGIAVLATSGIFALNDAAATATNILLHEQRFWLGFTFNLAVILSYLIVTALFYDLFRPVSRPLSLHAVLFSAVGCAVQAAALVFYATPWVVLSGSKYVTLLSTDQSQTLALLGLQLYVQAYNIGLAFFGCYCLLIGYLIFRSGFLPRILGVLMMFGGLSWLTFLSPPLASYLRPYNIAPGVLGEGALTLWLLFVGVNAQKWAEKAALQS